MTMKHTWAPRFEPYFDQSQWPEYHGVQLWPDPEWKVVKLGRRKTKHFRGDLDGWGHDGGREMGNNQFQEPTERSQCGDCGVTGHNTRRCTTRKKKSKNNDSRSSQPSPSQPSPSQPSSSQQGTGQGSTSQQRTGQGSTSQQGTGQASTTQQVPTQHVPSRLGLTRGRGARGSGGGRGRGAARGRGGIGRGGARGRGGIGGGAARGSGGIGGGLTRIGMRGYLRGPFPYGRFSTQQGKSGVGGEEKDAASEEQRLMERAAKKLREEDAAEARKKKDEEHKAKMDEEWQMFLEHKRYDARIKENDRKTLEKRKKEYEANFKKMWAEAAAKREREHQRFTERVKEEASKMRKREEEEEEEEGFGWGGGGLKVMEPPETTTTLTRADDARTFEFTIEFFPSKAKLGDGSLRDIEGDTIVKWEVELSEIDPQELQSMEEKAVRNVVEKIGESIFWGPEQEVALLWFDNWKGEYVRIEDGEEMVDENDRQNGWTTKQTTFRAELVDLKSDSKVGYVPSKLVAQMVDDDWASERQIMPMCTDEVELNEPTDLVIAPMDDTEMVKNFGIPVPDEDKEENDETTNLLIDAQRDICEDVDGQLMEDAADDVDDAHDDELVNVYDKENPVIAVGKLFPNMDEFRMCFKTYAVKHEFDAKTKWTERKKIYARCRGFDGSVKPCKWRKCAAEPLVVEDCWPKKKKRGNGCRKKRSYGETMQTEQDLDVLQNEQQDLDVFQNEDVVQNEQDLDVLQNQDVVQNEQDMDLVPNNYLRADVVQAEPILEVVLPNPGFPKDVVRNEQDMDLVPNDYLPADVVQAETVLEVVLPNPVFPEDVVPTKPILEVLFPTELDDIPADAVMKTKSLSELGIVVKRSTHKKKKKKKLK
ncbi:hypothetical protein D1007_56937 [Hordeum vulgare]|nr:hypothetical protein D1007_56937 [Hordeum vulgare]